MTRTTVDDCLRLLADGDRRRVLTYLHQRPARDVSVEEIATVLRQRRRLGTGAGGARAEERLRIRLEHAHLPKLAAHGVVEWDRPSGTVRYVRDDAVEAALDHLVESPSAGDS